MNDRDDVRSVLQAFARQDFRNWQGLPKLIQFADVVRLWPVESDWEGTGLLGSEQDEHQYHYVRIRDFDRSGRVWLQQGEVILLDVEYPPPTASLDELVGQLGEPEGIQDSYLGTLLIEKSEWIYAQRGLTLFVNPETRMLLRMAAFQQSDLESYLRHLRLNLRTRRTPQEVRMGR
jgi:hypothetical protein